MRIAAAVLILLVLLLQYRFWLGDGGMREVWRLREEVAAQQAENDTLKERNRTLMAEVQDLKHGKTAVEERARTDLGMVGTNESFYQVMGDTPAETAAAPTESASSSPHGAPVSATAH
jgi:cell division protein FtsB